MDKLFFNPYFSKSWLQGKNDFSQCRKHVFYNEIVMNA